MSKLRKMLLISTSIVLSSCARGIPDPPEGRRIAPIWRETSSGNPQVRFWTGQMVKAQTKFDWSNEEAYRAGLICTDVATYNAEAAYAAEMQRLAKERCR